MSVTISGLERRELPGDRDTWLFICAELVMFGGFFLVYLAYQAEEMALFKEAQKLLDRSLGLLNTVLLVTSSWAVARAVASARSGELPRVPRLLALAISLGLVFLVVKGFEYANKFAAGITIQSNDFFMFYFSLTIIHAAHVVGGSVVLVVLFNNARTGKYHPGQVKGLETGASYWHMVDLVWIMLFTLLYLV